MIGLHQISGQRILPLAPTEIEAFSRMTGVGFESDDLRVLLRMDALYRAIVGNPTYKKRREASISNMQGIRDVLGPTVKVKNSG